MNRRNFLISTVSTAVSIPLLNLKASDIINTHSFSMDILTDTPDLAISKLNELIIGFTNKTISFEEHKLFGSYNGDLAFVFNNRLLDFRRDNSSLSMALRSITDLLEIPRTIMNPVLLTFKTKEYRKPSYFEIYRNNELSELIKIDSYKKMTITSDKGELEFIINKNSAKVINTSCKHKTCIERGEINSCGDSIICIPNKIRISISGNNHFGIDSLTY